MKKWMYLEREERGRNFFTVPVGEKCRVVAVYGRLGERFSILGNSRVCGPWCADGDPILACVEYEFYED